MLKKILTYLMLFSFLHLVGCYSTSIMNPAQYQELKDHTDQPDEIIVNFYNNEKYKFARGHYFIINDTLSGERFAIKSEIEEPYMSKIPLSRIGSITVEEVDSEKTPSLVEEIIGITLVIIAIFFLWNISFNK